MKRVINFRRVSAAFLFFIALGPASRPGHGRLIVGYDNDFLHPTLQVAGKSISFPRAEQTVATEFLMFDLEDP